ncbi:PEP-CTERM sorting domain-containing protein [Neptunomonas qingdaonensis]
MRQASSTVPEPATMFLFVAGITGLALSRLRRKKK